MGRVAGLVLFWAVLIWMMALWAWWFWSFPIDCSNSLLNRVFHGVIPWSPLVVAVSALLLRFGPAFRWIQAGLIVIGVLSSIVIWFSTLFWWPSDTSGAGEERRLVHEVQLEEERLRAYRTNGGATTDYGVIVQREVPIVGPFFRYQRMYGAYHQMDVDLVVDAGWPCRDHAWQGARA